MRFSVTRILHNIKCNLPAYIIIMLHFMLGAALFVICINFRMTASALLQESKNKAAKGVIPVTQSVISWESVPEGEYNISYDTYLTMKADDAYAEELAFLFALGFSQDTIWMQEEQGFSSWIYFMNEELFEYLYGFSQNKDMVYLGQNAYRNLLTLADRVKEGETEDILFFPVRIDIEGDSLIIDGKPYAYEIVTPLEENTIMPGNTAEPGYDMAEAIILPIEEVFTPVSPYPGVSVHTRSILYFQYLTGNWREDIVARQLHKLNETNENIVFGVNNEYLELKRRLEDFSYDMDRWFAVAASILLLSGVGCMGLMFLLLDKRRHFIAVSITCGSTLQRIAAETILEIFLVLLSGAVLGILTVPLFQKAMVYQEELRFHVNGVIIIIIVAILFSVLSVLLGMKEVHIRDIANTLKEE